MFPGTAEKNSLYKQLARKIEAVKGGVVKTPPSTTSGLFLISSSGLSKKRKSLKERLTDEKTKPLQDYVKQKRDYLSGCCPESTLSGSGVV